MVPSFRLIGYYYDQRGNIIADSMWVDVKDECEIKVEVSKQNRGVQPEQSGTVDKQNVTSVDRV